MSTDVFISYSHRDNIPVNVKESGWIDNFHQALNKFLTEHLGREAIIYRDVQNNKPNYQLERHIEEKLNESIILVPIISPSFLQANMAPKELDYFVEEKGLEFVFPIYKQPVDKIPSTLGNPTRAQEFYKKDTIKEQFQLLDPALGEDIIYNFNALINDLATNIAKFIKEKDNEQKGEKSFFQDKENKSNNHKPKIYLAEPSPDLWEQYDEIRRDLEQRDCDFIPPNINWINNKPRVPEDFEKQVRKDIYGCSLVLHLIGKENSLYPKASEKSYLHLQTEIAAERDKEINYKRLIWHPKNIKIEDAEQKEFIRKLSSLSSRNVEFIQGSIEDFKTNIQIALNSKQINEFISNPKAPPWVYILHDECDIEGASNLEKSLNEKGIQTFVSKEYIKLLKQEEEIDADEIHNGFLSRCDSVLVYWNLAKGYWIKNSLCDIQKSKAHRDRPFIINGVFCDGDLEIEEDKLKLNTMSNFIKVASKSISNTLKENGFFGLTHFLSNLEGRS